MTDKDSPPDFAAMPPASRGSLVVLPQGYSMRSIQEVWIVGQRSDFTGETPQWTFIGVFTSKENAIAACRDWTYFVGACNLNESAPHEPVVDWLRDAHYPRGHEQPPE
jgi:hypothetical protein